MSDQAEPYLAAWERRAEWPLLALAVIFLGVYTVDILVVSLGSGWHRTLRIVDYTIWGLFVLDFGIRLALAADHARYWWRHLTDLAIIALPILRPLRVLRLVILLRVINRRFAATLRGRIVLYGVSTAMLLVFCAALAVLDAERHHAGANITSFGDALWWASVTICTVGYGDRFPVTTEGRYVAVGLMISGVALVGAVTASFAAWLIARLRIEEEDLEAATRRDLHAVHAKLDGLEVRLAELTAQLDGRAASASS